ncbi:MAG: hypothetical protein OEN20_12980 [Gammaproteobacteria bacterium]|nr:hypothetical protein [Gammaproteobacteria bacterium]
MRRSGALVMVLVLAAPSIPAGEVDVVDARLTRSPGGTYNATVTLRHADTGWEHYADKWDVVAPDGSVLATRVLYHPHVDEQPFTRSLAGIRIPADVDHVTVRAHDKVHGYRGKTLRLTLP